MRLRPTWPPIIHTHTHIHTHTYTHTHTYVHTYMYVCMYVLYVSKCVLYVSKRVLYVSKCVLYVSKRVLYVSKCVQTWPPCPGEEKERKIKEKKLECVCVVECTRHIRTPYMYALYACLICTPYMHALHACLKYMPCMFALPWSGKKKEKKKIAVATCVSLSHVNLVSVLCVCHIRKTYKADI